MRRKSALAAALAMLLTVLLAAADCNGDNGDGPYGDQPGTPTPPGTDGTGGGQDPQGTRENPLPPGSSFVLSDSLEYDTEPVDLWEVTVGATDTVLMSAEADAICGAAYGQRSDERVNRRNGYRARAWTPGPAPWSWLSRSYGKARTSLTGCWSTVGGPSRRWSPSWRRRICWVCRRGAWRSWPSSSV